MGSFRESPVELFGEMLQRFRHDFWKQINWKNGLQSAKNMIVYKIAYSTVDGKTEMKFMCLKILVGAIGFEPTTPCAQGGFRGLLKFIDFVIF
jgi:hypothetical protein